MPRRFLLKFLALFLVLFIVQVSVPKVFSQPKRNIQKKAEETKAGVDTVKKDEKKTYRELLRKAETSKGLFLVHRIDNDYYFEIPLVLMERDFLLVNKISSVPLAVNEAGINKGINTENKVIRFSVNKRTGNVWVETIVPQVESPREDAITLSVRDNFTGSVIESFKIETYSPDSSAVLIKVNKVFDGTEKSFNDVFNDIGFGTSPKSSLSAIERIKSFPENIVVKSVLTTVITEGRTTMPVSVNVTTNILLLPEKPMIPRFADARVGFFTTPRWYFKDDQLQMENRELITRWRLEPKPADRERYQRGELVEPVRPIVFYIDPATPRQWKQAIKDGITDWQKAFEQAGFKNAIQAREVTDTADFDADDVRYSVVTYAASPKSNAMGPSVIDPRSGEILESDVIWWHNVMTSLKYWMRVQTGIIDSGARAPELSNKRMAEAIRFVSSHEIGHTLGLKHNMGASSAIPVDSLRSPSFTQRMGTAPSIMDYARFNYVAQPEDHVKNITPQLGVYDKYAIEWGYRWLGVADPHAEVNILKDWIRRHEGDPLYRYGEQQNPQNVIDPRSQSEDLGDNSIRASLYGLKNLKRMIPQISSWVTRDGETFYEAGKLYMAAVQQWQMYSEHVIANIGGYYLESPVKGDGKDAYTPVPEHLQQQAFEYLKTEVFNVPEWLFNTPFLRKTFAVQDSPLGPFEYSPYNLRRSLQYDLIYNLVSDERLMRMVEAETLTDGPREFTASVFLKKMRQEIFKTTAKGQRLDVYQRMLQQNYVDALLVSTGKLLEKISSKALNDHSLSSVNQCDYMLNRIAENVRAEQDNDLRNIQFSSMSRTSETAVLKRGELLNILALLEKKRKTGDDTTRAHYGDLILRIRQNLWLN